MLAKTSVVVLMVVCVSECVRVRPCNVSTKEYKDNSDIFVSNCEKLPCKLKRKQFTDVAFKFTAQKPYPDIVNQVSAKIAGIPFPFIGVDGNSACGGIHDQETGKIVPCPLQVGKKYEYKNHISILGVYPRLKTIVHWALKSGNDTVVCFEVPARII